MIETGNGKAAHSQFAHFRSHAMRNLPLGTLISITILLPALSWSQEDKAPPGPEDAPALAHFAGEWTAEVTDKPSKWLPEGAKRTEKQSVVKILKNRYLLGREVSQADGIKILWLMTYDAKTKTYPFWYFNNKGVLGAEWASTWDDKSKIFTGKATDLPKGWTSAGTNRFSDRGTSHVAVWMKDETGTLLFDSTATKTRQPAAAREKTLATWSKQAADDKLPPELKILERLAGTWDVKAVSRRAVWTPKEVRTTSKVTRQWVLDGRFLQDTSESSDGVENISLLTYDPQMKAYRSWWFSSEGATSKAVGQWDAAAETMTFKSDLNDGLTSRGAMRFIDKDRHVWTVSIRDREGKLYFDGEWDVRRRGR
jgi:hypothetical protein